MSNKPQGDLVTYTCSILGTQKSMRYWDTLPHEMRCRHTTSPMRAVYCENCTVDIMEANYITMNNAYREGKPMLEDKDWDRYEQVCRKRFPACGTFHKVGTI